MTEWKFSQCFGDKGDIETITEADIISTVEFNSSGEYLATGDKGGRVVLFERNRSKKGCEYKFYTEFQLHDAEFDYLKLLEIEEKINKIKWLNTTNHGLLLLSTNDKTIKLWRVLEKQIKYVSENNLSGDEQARQLSLDGLHLPRMTLHEKLVNAQPKKIFGNAHAYHINSVLVNSDNETFVSADDLRINLWNLGIPDQSFNVVDIKPANMEELTEVITCAEFHPQSCNLFMYSLSKGTIKLADMREHLLCDQHAKIFEEYTDPSNHNFFTEITLLILDVKFSHDGKYIAARDYMTVKLWDLRMEREPVRVINIHEQLRDRLCDTYENDAIFDKFEVQFGGDNTSVMTGSYNNQFSIYLDAVNLESEPVVLQADKSAFKTKKAGYKKKGLGMMGRKDMEFDTIDFKKSILHSSWHPHEDSVAIAATNNLYIFSTL